MPPIDDEDPRLREQAPGLGRVGRLELAGGVEHRLERPVRVGQLVRLDVDERHPGVVLGHGLDPVERRSALLADAELRGGEDEHERLVPGQGLVLGRRVERRVRRRVGRDPRDVAADVGPSASRRTAPWRRSGPRPVCWTWNWTLTVCVRQPARRSAEVARPVPGRRERRRRRVEAALVLDRPDEPSGAAGSRPGAARPAGGVVRRASPEPDVHREVGAPIVFAPVASRIPKTNRFAPDDLLRRHDRRHERRLAVRTGAAAGCAGPRRRPRRPAGGRRAGGHDGGDEDDEASTASGRVGR